MISKDCPKCGARNALKRNWDGDFACWQCGFVVYISEPPEYKQTPKDLGRYIGREGGKYG